MMESEECYSSIVDNLPFGVHCYNMDKEGQLIFSGYNKTAQNILNIDHSGLDGKSIEEIFPHYKKEGILNELLKVAKTGNSWKTESGNLTGNETDQVYELLAYTASPGKLILHFTNITNRKEQEKSLYETIERLRITIDSMGDAVIVTDPHSIITSFNPVAEKLTAWKTTEAADRPLQEIVRIVSGISAQPIDNPVNKVLKYNKIVTLVEHSILISRKGNKYNISGSAAPIKDVNGAITGIVLVIRDVTESFRNMERLRESEIKQAQNLEQMEAIINAMPGMVSVVDKDFNVLTANNEVIKVFGFNSLSDIIGKKCYKTRKGLNEPCPQCGILKAFETRQLFSRVSEESEEKLMGIATKAFAIPLINKEGDIWGGVEVIMDITDVRNKEKAIRESEERLQLVISGANLGLWDWNLITNHLTFNERWAEILGYTAGELEPVYDSWKKLVHPHDMGIVTRAFAKHLKGRNRLYMSEFRMQHKNGSWRWISSRGKIVERDNDGHPVRAAGTHLDITDQKEMEYKLLKSNEEYQKVNKELLNSIKKIKDINLKLADAKLRAEESDNLKTAFLANLSHEIRTPMNGILGFADLLKNPALSSQKQSKYLSIIELSGKRMLGLINDLVDISKIESGQVEIQKETFNLAQLLNRICEFYDPMVIENNIAFTIEKLPKSCSCNIIADSSKLEQILCNLINNAFKYTTSGSIQLGIEEQEKHLLFWVKDTGKGIAPEVQDIIFNRFRQAGVSHLSGNEGSGLGLAICKSYVELMGGKIWVESALSQGSTFFFTIPCVKAEAPDRMTDSIMMPENKFHDNTILIAEDDESSFMYLNEVFNMNHMKILHASNGKEAVDCFKLHPEIKLILMDIKMPVMNGVDATVEIRKSSQTIPIIVQTAYASENDKLLAFSAGCTDIITKPVNKIELMQKVNGILA